MTTLRGRIYPIQSFKVPLGEFLTALLAPGNIMKNIAIKSNADPIFSQSTVSFPVNK